MFTYTRAIDKLRRLTKRKKVVQGGTWAGKTESIIGILIQQLKDTPDMDLTIVAETVPALKGGVLKIFKNILEYTGYWVEDHYNYTDRLYKFSSGGRVNFQAFDSVSKAKAAGKRTHLFINEAQYIPFNIAYELIIRSGWSWFDYNPNNPFWIHEEIIGEKDTDFIILTYKDNETTPEYKINEFNRNRERAKTSPYWENWCKVYIDGELGSLEGVIFSNWSIIPSVPVTGLRGYGMDFGYSKPASWVGGYVVDGKRIFDEIIYKDGLSNQALSEKMKAGGDINEWTYADSAEPKTIDELYSKGIKIKAVHKGGDSISFGISILQDEHFFVTARSVNLIKELREYSWDTDREGNNLDKPVKENDHAIDAMRYVAMETMSKSQQTRSGPMITLPKYY